MNIVDIIQDLKQYKIENKKTDDKNIYKSIQHNFLEGYIGAIMNNDLSDDSYEVYLYIKDKENIVSPLLLKKYNDVVTATNYFDELVYLIENNSEEAIINHCKIGL